MQRYFDMYYHGVKLGPLTEKQQRLVTLWPKLSPYHQHCVATYIKSTNDPELMGFLPLLAALWPVAKFVGQHAWSIGKAIFKGAKAVAGGAKEVADNLIKKQESLPPPPAPTGLAALMQGKTPLYIGGALLLVLLLSNRGSGTTIIKS